MNPATEQAHQNLRNILLNGRILINGLSLTGTELSNLILGEQGLYEKATLLDKTQEHAATAKKAEPEASNVVPFNKKGKK